MKKSQSFLALLLCGTMLANSALAFDVALPENASDSGDAAVPVLSEDSLAKFDKVKGELLYFDDFSDTSYSKSGYTFGVVHEDTRAANGTVVNPGEDHAFLASAAVRANSNPFFIGDAEKKTIDKPGKLTVDLKVYVDAAAAKGSFARVNKSDDLTNWSFNKAAGFGEWKSYSESWNATYFDSFDIGTYNGGDIASFYFDDVAVWYKPSEELILMSADGTAGETVSLGDGYTLAAPSALGYGTDGQVWKAADGTEYEAKAYTADELKGVVLYPADGLTGEHADVPALYADGKGALMYFNDFSGKDVFTNTLDLSVMGYNGAKNVIFDGYYARACGSSPLDPYTAGIEVIPNGDTWSYVTGEPFTGKLTMYAELYVNNDAAPGRYTVAAPGTDWCAYWTSWTCTGNAGAKAWSKTYSTATDVTGRTSFGLLSNNWKEEYCRALAVYAIPSNAYWLANSAGDASPAIFYYDGAKVTLPETYNGVSVSKWTDGKTKWTPGEVAASEVSGKKLYPFRTAQIPDTYIDGKGQLMYFNDFSGESEFTNMLDLAVAKHGAGDNAKDVVFDGYSARLCSQSDISPQTVGIELTYNGDTWSYVTGEPFTGKLTMYAELYVNNDAAPGRYTVATPGSDWGNYWTSWGCTGNAGAKAWSKTYTGTIDVAGKTRFGLLSTNWKEEYCRALAVYAIPYTGYWLGSGEKDNEPTIYFFDGDTVTLPAAYNGVEVVQWTDGTNKWNPGTVASSDVKSKKLYPYTPPKKIEAPAAYSPANGQLVYFENFSGDTFDNLADMTTYTDNTYASKTVFDGYYTRKLGFTKLAPYTAGVEVMSNGKTWTYADGTPLTGRLTMVADLYLNADSAAGHYTVAVGKGLGDGWGDYQTNWGCGGSNAAKAWMTRTSSTVNVSAAVDDTKGARFGILSNSTGAEEYCRAVAVYVKNPTNAFWLESDADNTDITYIIMKEDTYTLPASFAGAPVSKWSDGETVFNAGQSYEQSAIAGKVLRPYKVTEYAEVPAEEIDGIGELVWFENFDPDGTGFTNKLDLEMIDKGQLTSLNDFYCVPTSCTKSSPETIGVLVKPGEAGWTYTDGKSVLGKVTLVAEVYLDNADISQMFPVVRRANSAEWGVYDTDWRNVKPAAKKWASVQTGSYDADGIMELGFLTNKWSGLYVKSLAVYVQAPALESYAPVLPKKNTSIRLVDPVGIRFAAFVSDESRALSEEYGFIVALDDAVNDDYGKLVFDESRNAAGVNDQGVKYVSGVSYNKAENIDRVYTTDGSVFGEDSLGDGVYFTAIVYGMPSSAYATKLAARPYSVIDGKTIYGEERVMSIYEVAKAYAESCADAGQTVNAAAADIINTVEQAN